MKAIKFLIAVVLIITTIGVLMFIQQAIVLGGLAVGIAELNAKIIGFIAMMFIGGMILWGNKVFNWVIAPFTNKRTKSKVIGEIRKLLDEVEIMDQI